MRIETGFEVEMKAQTSLEELRTQLLKVVELGAQQLEYKLEGVMGIQSLAPQFLVPHFGMEKGKAQLSSQL